MHDLPYKKNANFGFLEAADFFFEFNSKILDFWRQKIFEFNSKIFQTTFRAGFPPKIEILVLRLPEK